MSHRERGYFATELVLGYKIVEGMNAWSLDLAESITELPATNLHLQYVDLESRFIRLEPVTQALTIHWILIVYPHVVR